MFRKIMSVILTFVLVMTMSVFPTISFAETQTVDGGIASEIEKIKSVTIYTEQPAAYNYPPAKEDITTSHPEVYVSEAIWFNDFDNDGKIDSGETYDDVESPEGFCANGTFSEYNTYSLYVELKIKDRDNDGQGDYAKFGNLVEINIDYGAGESYSMIGTPDGAVYTFTKTVQPQLGLSARAGLVLIVGKNKDGSYDYGESTRSSETINVSSEGTQAITAINATTDSDYVKLQTNGMAVKVSFNEKINLDVGHYKTNVYISDASGSGYKIKCQVTIKVKNVFDGPIINIPEPVAGAYPNNNITVTSDPGAYYITDVMWSSAEQDGGNFKFKPGETYQVSFDIFGNNREYNIVRGDIENPNKNFELIDYQVMTGPPDEMFIGYGNVRYKYTVPTIPISDTEINIETPSPVLYGEPYSSAVVDGDNYTAGVSWWREIIIEDGVEKKPQFYKFEPGKTYECFVSIRADEGYSFINPSKIKVKVNGKYESVRSYNEDNTLITVPVRFTMPSKLNIPSNVKVSNVTADGKPKVTWDRVYGAAKYYVYRATSKNGTYSYMYTTTNTSYINTSAVAGKTYYYKVKSVDANGNASALSNYCYITCDLAQPTNVKVNPNASSGKPKVTWNKVEGADKYYIYRSTSKNGTYSYMYSTTATSYTNTSAIAGNTYFYKVKAIDTSNEYANSACSNICYVTCDLAQPSNVKVSTVATSGKPKVTWNKVSGADKYYVYRSASKNGEYSYLGYTSGTSYVNQSAVAGKTYYYRVKAIDASNEYANSAYGTSVAITCDLPAPINVKSVLSSSGKPKITWTAVDGASKYYVYRATSKDGTYSYLGSTTNTHYTNTGAVAGKTYYYKVKAVHPANEYAYSAQSSYVSITSK